MKQDFLINVNGKPYKPAKFINGKRPYIEYWMFHIEKGKAVRRRFYQIRGESAYKRREHAKVLIKQINKMLAEGYIFGNEIPEIEKTGVVTPTLLKAFQQIVVLKQVQNGTRSAEAYRSFYNVFSEWYKQQKIDPLVTAFKKTHVLQYLDWLLTKRTYKGKIGVENVTRNNHFDKIHSIFEALKEREIVPQNPASGIKPLKENKKRNIPLSEKQQATLEKYLIENDNNLFVYTRLIYYCFLRPVEILRLKIRDIDLKNRTIMVRAVNSKNDNQASVLIPNALMPILKEMNLEKFPSEYFVFSKNDLLPGPYFMVRNRVSERHTQAVKAAGLYNGEITMYGWKHTGNKNAYLAGVDIKNIQIQNRHHSLDMTDIYLSELGVRIQKDLLDKDW